MPRQVWVVLLGAVALQACLCVSKTSASAQHPPSVNETTHSFRVAVIDPVAERVDGAEERVAYNAIKDLYTKIVGKTEFDLTFITSPEFNVWYNTVMNRFGPDKTGQMADYCSRLYGLSSFHRALNYAKHTLNDPDMALKLEDAAIQIWLHDKKMTAYLLYRLLQLHDNGKTMTYLPRNTWERYVTIRYPKQDPYGVLIAEGYKHAGEKIFFAHLIMDMWRSNRQKFAEVAIHAMLTNWQQKGLLEEHVYRVLMLEKTDAPLSSAVLRLWMFYTQRLGLDTNAKLFSHLQKCYKEEADLANAVITFETLVEGHIAGSLTENLLKHWSKLGKSPVDVAKLISLDETKHRRYKLEMLEWFCNLSRSKRCFNLDLLKQLQTLRA